MIKLPRKKSDQPFNDSFFHLQNRIWWLYIKNFTPKKPIVFLPCSRTKPYSKSMSHSFLKAITKNPDLEKIVISEPLVIVPYQVENEIPNYNYPPELVKTRPKEMRLFIQRLTEYLLHLKNSGYLYVYYVGGKHHYNILTKANKFLNLKIIAVIPEGGLRGYSKAAQKLRAKIPA